RRWASQGFTDLQRLGLAGGALGFFMFFDSILEINGIFGMSGVGVAFLIFIFKLRKRIILRTNVPPPTTLAILELAKPESPLR
ncbi:MAG: hypothetical protein AABX62_03025, partial [Thermoproteota archaeon]